MNAMHASLENSVVVDAEVAVIYIMKIFMRKMRTAYLYMNIMIMLPKCLKKRSYKMDIKREVSVDESFEGL